MVNLSLIRELENYIERHLNEIIVMEKVINEAKLESLQSELEIEDFLDSKLQPTFQQILLTYMDTSGHSDTTIYKSAGLDRRHFSKIRSNSNYQPTKPTVIALALALKLSIKETEKLLNAAGFALSDGNKFDLVIRFCMEKEIFDRFTVNELLDHFGLKTLG